MFVSVCIFASMVCARALSFLDEKIYAIQEPSIIIIIIIIIIIESPTSSQQYRRLSAYCLYVKLSVKSQNVL